MVTQSVHLKTLSPLGHRDSAPHVMQLPEAKSLSPKGFAHDGPVGCADVFCLVEPGPNPSISASESESEAKSSGITFFGGGFFLVGNIEGNGWLTERP